MSRNQTFSARASSALSLSGLHAFPNVWFFDFGASFDDAERLSPHLKCFVSAIVEAGTVLDLRMVFFRTGCESDALTDTVTVCSWPRLSRCLLGIRLGHTPQAPIYSADAAAAAFW